MASATLLQVISRDGLLPEVAPAEADAVGAPGSATHVVDSVAPLEAHVLPQSFVAFTQQVYDVYGSSDVTDPAVLEDVVPTPEPTATSSHDPPLVTQK